MSLAHRIIPTILCRGREAVKGVAFQGERRIGSVAEKIRVHALRGVDELCLLDITATREGRGPDLAMVEELTDTLFAPLAVGGGIRTLQDVKDLLRAGADKVVLGTEAWSGLLRQTADVVGSQAIVVIVDAVETVTLVDSLKLPGVRCTRPAAPARAKWAQEQGAGEILLQAVERDGTMRGYDLQLIDQVSEAVSIPVIASGGAGCYAHMAEAILAGANAVAAGAMFQFTDQTPKGAARYLEQKGIEARV